MFEKKYIHRKEGFSQAVFIETKETITIHVSGQIGEGNDLESQTTSLFNNLQNLLKECSATFKDVVKMNTYIVNFNPEIDLPIFRKVRENYLGTGDYPASTLVGVTILGNRNWLIEMDAIAIIEKL